MIFNNIEIKTTNLVKFLGVTIDKNLTQKNQAEIIKNEISKDIVLPYRTSHLLDLKSLLKIC